MRPIYFRPLPKLTDLVGTYATPGLNSRNYFPESAQRYSLGRWAIAAAVSALAMPGACMQAWLPEYICGVVPDALRSIGVGILYYPVNERLQPDWEMLARAGALKSGQIFLLVHYFGIINDVTRAGSFCDRHGLFLVEDAAHCLPTEEMIRTFRGDALVFSPHKVMPLPGYGVLVMKGAAGSEAEFFKTAGVEREAVAWFLRNSMKKYMLALRADPAAVRRIVKPSSATFDREETSPPTRAGQFVERLFRYHMEGAGRISEVRRANYRSWQKAVEGIDGVSPVFDTVGADETPQVFPLFVSGDREVILSGLREAGVPCDTWPDLPAEILAKSEHREAVLLQKRIILLPVHQDLNEKQIRRITSAGRDVLMRRTE